MMITVNEVKEMFEAAKYHYENESGKPVIYYYNEKVALAPNSSVTSHDEAIYRYNAPIIVDFDKMKEYLEGYDFTEEEAIRILTEDINEFLTEES